MLLLSFLSPILAHGEGDVMSLGELLLSVGLLLVSSAIAATMLILVFMKPIIRVRRQWKEGRLPHSSRTMYVILIAAVICAFLAATWNFGSAAYYDIHQQRYEEKLEASGKHAKKGAEYKWNRWHIGGGYQPDKLILFVEDIFEKADPQQEITATARLISPSTTGWKPMTWDPKLKAFTAKFDPEGEKMEFEFHMKSGWSSYTDDVIGYIPKKLPKNTATD